MSILQFFRILWAGRIIILVATVALLASTVVLVEVVTPTYQAQTRVILEVLKPDPVTGQVMATAFLRAYTKTQIELVKDYQVARNVVDSLHWEKKPSLLREYRQRAANDDRDFNRWAAQRVIDGTNAKVIEGSNILEISYNSSNPDMAKQVADALRGAYIATTLQSRQEAARRNAEWYDAQAVKAKASLFDAEQSKSNFERENGILLQDDRSGLDLDSARLSALAAQANAPQMAAPQLPPVGMSQPELQLQQMDAELAQASKVLGPNHPQLLEMRRKREMLAKLAADERAAAVNAISGASAARVTANLLNEQKSKVLAQRDKVERLRLLQDDVNLRREEYNKAAARAAELRQEAEVADAGVTPLGAAVTPQDPIFPQKLLLSGVGLGAGIALGIVIVLIRELFGRRIRSSEDLHMAIEVPVLAVVSRPHTRTGLHLRDRLKRWFMRWRGMPVRAA